MTNGRRWDTDLRGHGIAGAPDAAVDADRLAEALRRPDWIAEDPEAHLVPHIEQACSAPESRVTLLGWSVTADGTLVVRLEPREPVRDRRSWRAAAYAIVGAVAETRVLVREDPVSRSLEVLTGVLDGDTAFAAHGHRIRIEPGTPL